MKAIRRKVEERSGVVGVQATGERDHNAGDHARFGFVLREKGHEAMRTGQAQMAVQLYTQSLRHEVTVPLLCQRADAYLKLEMYDDVIKDCTEITTLQPKVWRAYALRAAAFREQGCFAEAMADLRLAKRLCPKRANHFERMRAKCKREVDGLKRARHLEAMTEEGSKQPSRPFVKGDKRVTPAQLILRMRECVGVISRVLHEPGSGATIWKEDELIPWKRVRMRSLAAMAKPHKEVMSRVLDELGSWGTVEKEDEYKSVRMRSLVATANPGKERVVDYDNVVIFQRLEEMLYALREGGQEVRSMLGQSMAFPTLLAAYGHQDLLVLEIIHEALQDGDDIDIRAFLRAQPLPILAKSFQDSRQPVRNIACALMDLVASYKSQQILTLLIHEDLIPLLLKSMHLGSAAEHAHSVSLFFKLALDPRLLRHLSSLPSLTYLCEGLIRACRAGKLSTRLHGAQTISTLLGLENARQRKDWKASVAESCDCNAPSLLSTFADGGVLRELAQLLARESEKVPEKAETVSSIWEGEVELICEEIASTVGDFSEEHECTLRDFRFLSGYAQVVVYSAVQAMDFMAAASHAVEVLDQIHAWGLFVPLLSSFPDRLAALSAQTLAKFCRRSKQVAMHVANLWPANSSLIVLELARSAQRSGDSQTSQAAILILAELAVCKSFLTSMQKPTSFTILFDFLQDGQSSTVALGAICTCLAVALTSSDICLEYAEMKAYALGGRLFQLWCERRTETQLRWQVENLMFVLMDKSSVLQQAILCLLENGKPSDSHSRSPGKYVVSYKQPPYPSTTTDESAAQRYHAFTHNRINFQKVCFFLSTLVHPSTKFADLCAGAGLLSIQVAKHFKEIHCYAVNRKRVWVEHTRRLAKQEAVQNLTAVLSKRFDLLPHTLPASLDVAILCLSLDIVQDFGLLFRAVRAKLQPQGKLVLIDDNEELVIEARMHASSFGLNVVLQSRLVDKYFVLMLQKETS